MNKVMTTYDHWQAWSKEDWTILPYVISKPFPGGDRVGSWKPAWEQASPYAFVLESGKDGRYTYLGLDPVSVITGKGNRAKIEDLTVTAHEKLTHTLEGDPLPVLEEWISPYTAPRVEGIPPFSGGIVGYLSYDIARSLERLPVLAEDNPELPDYIWMRFDEVWMIDHESKTLFSAVYVLRHAELSLEEQFHQAGLRAERMMARAEQLIEAAGDLKYKLELEQRLNRIELAAQQGDASVDVTTDWESSFAREAFEQAVRKVQDYISQGDVFQVNLSLRQQKELHTSPEDVYEWLRVLNPSPYMGYVRTPEFELVSGSPELLVKLDHGQVVARPIAGTRRRGTTPEEDERMASELLHTEKERAEHIMLVDLERNDIGRVAQYGTVRVPELMTIEYYSHVMHLVSQVEGTIADGKNAFDVIAAAFPGGTITGAPKVRTMEIIEELEPVRRGPYTGSIGWIGYHGDMELNIVIRTLTVIDGIGYIQAGAGIVIDSDPYREYRESKNKARAVMKAVQYSEEAAFLDIRSSHL
ncbi:anthranilate synthase component I family protein [Paenibacillus provencensis]|uniref:Anthranilate synthase component I family protein n=1 Tax=Paenibacillus provencensis TaxID=441151 RepID=A0ABW3PZJ8_9BACL|nr:anthranilate synthase component I family protein [Paenibacillus sp. MER 78]MCM3130788.1 anthranilate synthase component I family protein [Paenibacillus sp. MER 78]